MLNLIQTSFTELDRAGNYVEFDTREAVVGRVQVRMRGGASWGAGVIAFHGSVSDDGEAFDEISASNRLSAPGLSGQIDLLAIRRLRVVINTAGTSGAFADITFGHQNPYK